MWWQLQLGGQDVGVGADKHNPTVVSPPAPASTPSGSRALSLGTDGLFLIFRGRTYQTPRRGPKLYHAIFLPLIPSLRQKVCPGHICVKRELTQERPL